MNKPIAWVNEYQEIEPFNPDNRQDWTPLYTHPADLTDDEINDLIINKVTDADMIKQALRKAQEK
jgi:hypothetical protein